MRASLREGAVIVASILLAFAIDAWWDRYKSEALEQDLLVSLERGFEENIRLAKAVAHEARRQQVIAGRVIAMSPEEAAHVSPDSTYMLLRALWRPNYVTIDDSHVYGPDLNNAALVSTLQAGQLSLLTDRRLLTALAVWQGVTQELSERSRVMIEIEQQVLRSLAQYPEMQAALAGLTADGELRSFAATPPRVTGSVLRFVRANNELMAQVAQKSFVSRAQQDFLENIENRAEAVLGLVRENLNR
ncbi:MAG TPA: hypothetical protein VJB38_00215 [Bacteroidota bacterium]|nr:hypothetical protein [Bacteroidota bacterium]